MEFTIGHFFYISGMISPLLIVILFLSVKILNIFFDKYENPDKAGIRTVNSNSIKIYQ